MSLQEELKKALTLTPEEEIKERQNEKEIEEIKQELDQLSESIEEKFQDAVKNGMEFKSEIPPEMLKQKYLKYKAKYLTLKSKLN